jgi:hypothetical protein
MNRERDDAPDDEFRRLGDLDFRVMRILGCQIKAIRARDEPLDGQFAAHAGDHDVAVFQLQRAVNDEAIARMNLVAHRIALNANDEGGELVSDQPFVEINVFSM